MKIVISERWQQEVSVRETEAEVPSNLNFNFLKSKTGFLLAGLILITVGISILGIYLGKAWSIIPLFLLVLPFFFGSNEMKAILITPVSILSLVMLASIRYNTSLVESGLIVFLVSQMLSENKALRTIAIINYLLYTAVCLLFIHSWFFIIAFLFAGLIRKKLMPVTAIIAILSLALIFKHLYSIYAGQHAFKLTYLSIPLLLFAFLMLWKGQRQVFMRISGLAIPFVLMLHFIFSPLQENNKAIAGIKNTYYKVNSIKAADVTPVQSLRPLKYLEYPIQPNDPFTVKFGTAMVILGHYLKLAFLPYPMSFYYGYAYIVPTPFLSAISVIVFILHLLMLAIAIYFVRSNPLLSFSILFYLVSISVFSNLFIPIPGMMGDRFLLIPSIGFCVFLVVALGKIFKQDFTDPKLRIQDLARPLKISLSIILVLYSLVTVSRNLDWKDRITLFRKDIKAVENSAQAQNLLGLHLFLESNKETDQQKQKQMREEAVPHLRKAVEIYPAFLNASFDLARLYEAMQQVDSAYVQYERTRLIDSSFTAPCFNMAVIQQNKGNLEQAIRLYEKFLTKYPTQIQGYANLSYAYYMMHNYDSSVAVNKRALTFIPNSYEINVNIGRTYLQINNRDSALVYLQEANRLKPGDPTIQNLMQQLR